MSSFQGEILRWAMPRGTNTSNYVYGVCDIMGYRDILKLLVEDDFMFCWISADVNGTWLAILNTTNFETISLTQMSAGIEDFVH